MAESAHRGLPPSLPDLSCRAAIVGIGETDYGSDYRAARVKGPGYGAPSPETLVTTAFERALADSGLHRSEIDGLTTSFIYGGPPPEVMARQLGLSPRYLAAKGNIMAGPLPAVCADIAAGKADTVVMLYAAASRAIGRKYGGSTYAALTGTPQSYYFYHPWGWSSQAAHWALMFAQYQHRYGATEADLGAVAVQVRNHAATNPAAIMRDPITIEDYLAARMIVQPMRLLDLCLVNDGAVCLIVRRSDLAEDTAQPAVHIAGWSEALATGNKFDAMVRTRLAPELDLAGRAALNMAGLDYPDIGHFEGYDPSTIQLINQIEGYGFAEPGTGLELCKAGQMDTGGRLPTNTAGGNLSGAYMHGWSQVAECVRQLRGTAGTNQVPGLQASLFSLAQSDAVHPLIFTRECRS